MKLIIEQNIKYTSESSIKYSKCLEEDLYNMIQNLIILTQIVELSSERDRCPNIIIYKCAIYNTIYNTSVSMFLSAVQAKLSVSS